jgi:hypothetical protein
MRTTLIAWCASALALVPAAAGEALVTRAQALTDAPGRDDAAGEPASPAPGATVAQRLEDEAGIELIVALIRAGQHERAAVYLEDQALPGRYRLLMRIPPERHPDPGFAPPQILHPLVDQGPERAWLVRISRPTGGNGGWMEERLLSLRRSGAGAPALDEVDFVAAPQAYQPFLAPGEAVLSAEWDDFAATPMAFRFQVWGPHDPHVDPRGGVVSGSYRLSADAGRPGCYRLEAARFDRVAAAPRAER